MQRVMMMSSLGSNAHRRVIRGVVFDMDGTLIAPSINFAEMRRRIGLEGYKGDILAAVNRFEAEEREAALQEIHAIEMEALQRMRLQDDTAHVCTELDRRGIPRALVTRNMKASVDHFHTHKFPLQPFQPSLCRETFHAHKPSPEPLLHIAGLWGVSPRELAMVGDSAKDDVVSGNRAGALTILLRNPSAPDNGGADPDEDNPERIPTFTVASLSEALDVLIEHTVLQGPMG